MWHVNELEKAMIMMKLHLMLPLMLIEMQMETVTQIETEIEIEQTNAGIKVQDARPTIEPIDFKKLCRLLKHLL